MGTMRKTRDVLLDCLHVMYNVPPAVHVGSTVTCETSGCDNGKAEVVEVMVPDYEWVVECQDCHYVKYCGQAPALGKLYSSKHRSTTGHHMRLRKTTDEYERGIVINQPTLY